MQSYRLPSLDGNSLCNDGTASASVWLVFLARPFTRLKNKGMKLIKLFSGGIKITGKIPLGLLADTTALELVAGRRTVAGVFRFDGGYKFEFTSSRRVLWATVYALSPNAGRTLLCGFLCVNLGRKGPARTTNLEEQMVALEHLQIPEVTAQRSPPAGDRPWHINWIIPDIDAGAGGLSAIFRIAHEMEAHGHRHVFWIMGRTRHENLREYVGKHFTPLDADFRVLATADVARIEGDLVIASNDTSAYYVRGVGGVSAKAYLVQDYEPLFYPAGAYALTSEKTYGFGFKLITAGAWLHGRLAGASPRPVRSYDLPHDPAAYFAPTTSSKYTAKVIRPRRHISFYARATTCRRAVSLGLCAFKILALRRSDFTVHLFGQTHCSPRLPFPFEEHGVLSPAELGELYRRCDVGVVFSATNHSLVPHEMMACGLPVVELAGAQNQAVYSPGCIVLAEPDPAAIAEAVEKLLDETSHAEAVRLAGYAQIKGRSWARSAAAVEAALGEALRGD